MKSCAQTLRSGRIRGAALIIMSALGAFSAGTAALAGTATLMAAQQGAGPALNPAHPERYVVRRGDTLWDISAMFLRDPWYWPEIWQVNPQVANPHLIYPGDVLTLVYIDGQPRITLQRGAGRLSPRIRTESLEDAVPTIPYEVIGAFLSRGSVLQADEIERMPYVLSVREGHLMAGAGNELYVRGELGAERSGYNIVHIGDALVDPDDNAILGYEGIFVGEGTLRRGGDPGTLFVNDSAREALEGDRLMQQSFSMPLNFYPRRPDDDVEGRIIGVFDGVSRIGQYQIVVLNRGTSHGLDVGHVLTAWQAGETVPDRVKGGFMPEKVRLPDEKAGTLMVFRSYDRVSYALVMEATSEIHVLDRVRSPS